MKIAIATPILFNQTSPFNHLFQDIIGGFLESGNQIIRFVACRNLEESDFKYGYTETNIQYIKYKRKESAHNNIITRYVRDTLTSIRESYGIVKYDADILFEDVCYTSFWTVRAAKKKNMKVIAMIQDVWPDNAVQSGLIKKGKFLYKYFELWQRYVYRNADKIVCISDDMKDFIVAKGVDEKKIEVIYNWGYSDDIVQISWDENEFVKKYKLGKDKFYVVYAGNIGKMQNVELIVEAAKKLQNEDSIHFLIIGDGVKKKEIEELAGQLCNVTVLPLQPGSLAEHIYCMAGVNVIPLVEGGTKTAMPSKTGVVLSCGRPVIFCFGSESNFARTVEKYDSGMSVSAIDANELAEAILNLRYRKLERCKGSDKLFQDLFTRNKNINRYKKVVCEI